MFVCALTLAYVGARLARDEGDAGFQEPRRLFREQALLPQPSGAMRRFAKSPRHTWLTRVDEIQRSIGQQLTQVNHLRHAERDMPPRAFQIERQVVDHGTGRGQGFAEVRQ